MTRQRKTIIGALVGLTLGCLLVLSVRKQEDKPQPAPVTEVRDPAWDRMVAEARGRKEKVTPLYMAPDDQLARQPTLSDTKLPDYGFGMLIPESLKSQPPDPGTGEELPPVIYKVVYQGSIPEQYLMDYYHGLGKQVADMTNPALADFAACKAGWLKRGGKLIKDLNWVASLRLAGDGKQLKVVGARIDADQWPAELDSEAKACVLSYLNARGAPSPDVVEATVDFPLCFSVP